MFDEQKWLVSFDGENPSGSSLRNEHRFAELTRLATPVFQEEVDANNEPIVRKPVDRKAEPLPWDEVLDLADELATIGRDIRLLTIVARAMLGQEGIAGAVGGLNLIAAALEQFWDSVHPVLRDGNNPTRRLNALLSLEEDEAGFYGDLMRAEVMSARGVGAVTFAELAQSNLNEAQVLANAADGLGAAEKAALADRHQAIVQKVTTVCRAMADQNAEELAELGGSITALLSAIDTLENIVAENLGEPKLRLPLLRRCIQQSAEVLATVAAAPDIKTEEETQTVTLVTEANPEKAPTAVNTVEGEAIPNQLNSREDVQRCLQLIIDFYDKTEPSSPIPLLAKRMKKMVPMNFMELMQELAPSGLKEFSNVAGKSDKK